MRWVPSLGQDVWKIKLPVGEWYSAWDSPAFIGGRKNSLKTRDSYGEYYATHKCPEST